MSNNKRGTGLFQAVNTSAINSTNDVGTLELSENIKIAGDGVILQDLGRFAFSDVNKTITYADDTTATVTGVIFETGETESTELTSSVIKTISSTSPEEIILDGRTFTVSQSGNTINISNEGSQRMVSLEQGNLVISKYDTDTGIRTVKEIIFDSDNSIGEINGASHDLKVKSLDVTKTDSIIETTPTEGSIRIDSFIIHNYDTITYGSNGGDITATSSSGTTHNPTSTSVFLQSVASSTDTTYHWDLTSFIGSGNGTLLNLIFDKEDDTGITALQINFGSNKLYASNGKNASMTFDTSGQSSSLIYMDSAWRIISNNGGTVA
jgi:hypothetical protein